MPIVWQFFAIAISLGNIIVLSVEYLFNRVSFRCRDM